MPNIIFKVGQHMNEDAIDRLIHYIYQSDHYFCGGCRMVLSSTIDTVIESFKVVQNHFDKTNKKKIHHFIIGFEKKDCMTPGLAIDVAERAMEYLGMRFQCCYAIHNGSNADPNYLHIHLAVNTVSWLDGVRLTESKQILYDLAAYLRVNTGGVYYHIMTQASSPYDPK